VIYSSSDRHSFVIAERILQTLWTSENIAQKAVILVGNKADLARSRSVSTEGKISNLKLSCLHLSFLTGFSIENIEYIYLYLCEIPFHVEYKS
jgi:Rad and Gem related GTP binding protein 1